MTRPASLEPPGRAFETVGDGGPRDMVATAFTGGTEPGLRVARGPYFLRDALIPVGALCSGRAAGSPGLEVARTPGSKPRVPARMRTGLRVPNTEDRSAVPVVGDLGGVRSPLTRRSMGRPAWPPTFPVHRSSRPLRLPTGVNPMARIKNLIERSPSACLTVSTGGDSVPLGLREPGSFPGHTTAPLPPTLDVTPDFHRAQAP